MGSPITGIAGFSRSPIFLRESPLSSALNGFYTRFWLLGSRVDGSSVEIGQSRRELVEPRSRPEMYSESVHSTFSCTTGLRVDSVGFDYSRGMTTIRSGCFERVRQNFAIHRTHEEYTNSLQTIPNGFDPFVPYDCSSTYVLPISVGSPRSEAIPTAIPRMGSSSIGIPGFDGALKRILNPDDGPNRVFRAIRDGVPRATLSTLTRR